MQANDHAGPIDFAAIALANVPASLVTETGSSFLVEAGTADSGGSGLAETQTVRLGGGVDVTVSVDDPAIAELEVGASSGSSFDVTIPALASDTALTLSALTTPGFVTVSATGTNPGEVDATPDASQVVQVVQSGCGLGFEIAPILAGIAAWRARRRAGREKEGAATRFA